MTFFRIPLVFSFSLLILQACTGSSGDSSDEFSTLSCKLGSGSNVTISGKATYDRVGLQASGALDFDNISTMPVRGVVVQAICNTAIAETTTDANGNYSLSIPANTQNVFIRVKAQMLQSGSPGWDVAVSSSSSSSELIYSMDGGLFNSGSNASTRNLHAPTGWNGSSYASTRTAAPFAILDTVYESMQFVLSVAPSLQFPALDLKWGPTNTSGTNYSNSLINVLGSTADTDEFDAHVIAHEWGHYFQDMFSRDESIGGPHSLNRILDIRVAFSEGFGNAFSAMVTGDPIYKDSQSVSLGTGFSINLESNSCFNDGWYNECTVQSVLYDFFDTAADTNDVFTLGFTPIYNVLTTDMVASDSLTSLFSFINGFKLQSGVAPAAVDTLLADQSITTSIADDYGTGIDEAGYLGFSITPVYLNEGVDDTFPITLCTLGENGGYNGLGVTRFARFTVPANTTYTFSAVKNGGETNSTDPDVYIRYKGELVGYGETFTTDSETFAVNLETGKEYVLELMEYRTYGDIDYNPAAIGADNQTCFTVSRS